MSTEDSTKDTAETVTTWANGFGIWHARVAFPESGYGPTHLSANIERIRSKARRAIRREISQRQNVDPGWRCPIEVAETDLDHMNVTHSITFREVAAA